MVLLLGISFLSLIFYTVFAFAGFLACIAFFAVTLRSLFSMLPLCHFQFLVSLASNYIRGLFRRLSVVVIIFIISREIIHL